MSLCLQVHGCLLQVGHLLNAHASSLPASEASLLFARTAELLLERAWLATQLCTASAVRTQYLRAAGALVSAVSVARLPGLGSSLGRGAAAEANADAAPALAQALMGICQEAIISQEEPAAADSSLRQSQFLEDSHGAPAATIRQQDSTAGGSAAGTARSSISFCSNGDSAGPEARPVDMADAGADGADAMRAVFLKEAALLYFSPALRSLAGGKPTGSVLFLRGDSANAANATWPCMCLSPLHCCCPHSSHSWHPQPICQPQSCPKQCSTASGEGCAGGEAGVEGLQQEEVRAALEHPLYDVRAATLKALLAQCKGVRAVSEELQAPQSGALGLFRAPGWRHSLTLSLRDARAPLP